MMLHSSGNDIVHFIKHAAQIGKDGTTKGKAIARVDGWMVYVLCWRFAVCILGQLCLPEAKLLLCLLHAGTEGGATGEVAALMRGW
jgi:hypothetical protein